MNDEHVKKLATKLGIKVEKVSKETEALCLIELADKVIKLEKRLAGFREIDPASLLHRQKRRTPNG